MTRMSTRLRACASWKLPGSCQMDAHVSGAGVWHRTGTVPTGLVTMGARVTYLFTYWESYLKESHPPKILTHSHKYELVHCMSRTSAGHLTKTPFESSGSLWQFLGCEGPMSQ